MVMCHSGVDAFVISRPVRECPIKRQLLWKIVRGGFTVVILQLSHVFKRTSNVSTSTVAKLKTGLQKL